MTPREVYLTIEGVLWQMKYQSYQTAVLIRTEKMPKFEHLIDPPRTKPLSDEEAKALRNEHNEMIKALPERFRGGPHA